MNMNRVTVFSRFILLGVMIVASFASMVSGVSVANARPALGISQVDILDDQISDNHFGQAAIASVLSPTLSISDSCGGPVITLSGVTTSRYTNRNLADGTIFNRSTWYSNAVDDVENSAFSVGSGDLPPYDVCVFRGVINGHIPLGWDWRQVHDFGGTGDRTETQRLARSDGTRIHNVEDGWKPRQFPEFGNTGIMQMRNAYMTGIRDDSIENDDFMPGFVEDSLFDGVDTFLSEQNQSGGTPVTIGSSEDPNIRITRVYVRLYSTNSSGNSSPGHWFKWQALGTTNHNLIITDSVFATHGPEPRDGWSALDFPDGTTFEGTNYILWLGTPGQYDATIPAGVTFLEGQAAFDKWNQVRNTWLIAHGYDPRPLDDFNPMDDPVVAADTIRFGVIGDYGDVGQPELDVANRVKSWNPDFIITTGDNNYSDGAASTIDANIGQYYHEFIYPYTGSYGSGATVNRFFPSLGNHDWHAVNAQPYLDYFTLPNNERYYDFVQGPVHFFVIDSDDAEPDGNSSDSIQAQWLQAKLAASTSPWNLVYMHHPPYSSGLKHGSSENMRWPYQEWGADAVLTGHDHTYERIVLNGFPYFVNGLGGRPVYQFGIPVLGSQVRYNADNGAMLVEANESQITFQFITRTGVIIDTYTLNILSLPSVPVLVSPANNALTTDYTPTLDWSDSTVLAGATFDHYQIQIATDVAFSNLVTDLNITGISNSNYTPPSDLAHNTKFYWRVRAVNASDGISAWSAVRNFRTALTLPINLATINSDILLRPAFDWDANLEAGVTGYTIQISTSSTFASYISNTTVTASLFTPGVNLPKKKNIYWRVRTLGANGPSAWTLGPSFLSANPPGTPTLSLPALNALNKNYTPLFKWSVVTLPAGTTFKHYQLQVDNNADFSSLVIDDISITNRSTIQFQVVTPLTHNVKFYWRVRAVNTDNEAGSWSAKWYFRTRVDAPTLLSPGNGDPAGTRKPTFDWTDVANNTGYTIQVSASPSFGTLLINTSTASNVSTYTPTTNLPAGKTLYWRVRTKSPNGPSAWSIVFSFTTP